MGLRFRQSFRLWKGASIIWSSPLRSSPTSGNPGDGCTLLVAGVLGVIVCFVILGLITGRSGNVPANAVPAQYSPIMPRANSLSPEAMPPPSNIPLPAVVPAQVPPVQPEAVKPVLPADTVDLKKIDPAVLYARLGLADKGFLFNKHAETNRLFWTWRKTDTGREYTAVFLADELAAPRAITLELVDTSGAVDVLARNYFKTVLTQILPSNKAAEAESWLAKLQGMNDSKTFAGLELAAIHTGNTHRRLTIQPKP